MELALLEMSKTQWVIQNDKKTIEYLINGLYVTGVTGPKYLYALV
jgi:hypothetical protein